MTKRILYSSSSEDEFSGDECSGYEINESHGGFYNPENPWARDCYNLLMNQPKKPVIKEDFSSSDDEAEEFFNNTMNENKLKEQEKYFYVFRASSNLYVPANTFIKQLIRKYKVIKDIKGFKTTNGGYNKAVSVKVGNLKKGRKWCSFGDGPEGEIIFECDISKQKKKDEAVKRLLPYANLNICYCAVMFDLNYIYYELLNSEGFVKQLIRKNELLFSIRAVKSKL
jgi:hypothetical protein